MCKLQNGWTIETIMARIKERNTGEPARTNQALVGSEFNKCYYRSPTGNQCLVGCFIDNRDYSGNMEGMGIEHLEYSFDLNYSSLPLSTRGLERLQTLHDNFIPGPDELSLHDAVEQWLYNNVEA